MKPLRAHSAGLALFSVLMLLVMLTVLVMAMVRTNALEMRMAHNFEAKAGAEQRAQAALDGIYEDATLNTERVPIRDQSGYKICVTTNTSNNPTSCPASPACINQGLTLPSALLDKGIDACVTAEAVYPPPRAPASMVPPGFSLLKIGVALLRIEATSSDGVTSAEANGGLGVLRGLPGGEVY